jgi:predicted transcriptional regulator
MNANKLKAKCIEKGLNIETLSKNVGIGRGSFYRKLKDDSFSVKEVRKIASSLELTQMEITDIFFNVNVA